MFSSQVEYCGCNLFHIRKSSVNCQLTCLAIYGLFIWPGIVGVGRRISSQSCSESQKLNDCECLMVSRMKTKKTIKKISPQVEWVSSVHENGFFFYLDKCKQKAKHFAKLWAIITQIRGKRVSNGWDSCNFIEAQVKIWITYMIVTVSIGRKSRWRAWSTTIF